MTGWKVVVNGKPLDLVHKTYKSAIFAAQVLRGTGVGKVKIVREAVQS